MSAAAKEELESAAAKSGAPEAARTAALVRDPWKQDDVVAALKTADPSGEWTQIPQ